MSNSKNVLFRNGGEKVRISSWPVRGHFGVEEKAAVNRLFDKAIEIGNPITYGGDEEKAYCKEFSDFLGGGYADGVNSGTTAVFVALKALDIEPFTEVIVAAVTDPGGIMPIALNNCIPVIADTAPGSYNTNAEEIEKMITPLTSAIIVPHIGGEPADIENIVALAKKHGIRVIEDCAQAHGAVLNNKKVGTFGDIAAFSTMFGKHHCSGGQGGIVFTKNEELYRAVCRSADRGKPIGLPAGSTNCEASLNFNMDEISAAIGQEQLKKLPAIITKRQKVVEKLIERFKNCKSIIIPELRQGAEHVYWWWKLRVNTDLITCSKAEFCAVLAEEGLPIAINYRTALPWTFDWFKNKKAFGNSHYPWASPMYKGDKDREYSCPNVMDTMNSCFNLVLNESWLDKEINNVVEIIKKVENAYLGEH